MLVLLLASQQPQTITFQHPCAHSSVVLAALGQQVGKRIGPGGSVNQDYIAIKLTDRPVNEAMRVIAETLNAEWIERNGVLYLDRGPKQHNAELSAEKTAMRSAIKRWLDATAVPPFDRNKFKELVLTLIEAEQRKVSPSQAQQELWKQMPQARLGPSLVRALGGEDLADIPLDETQRYYLLADGSNNMPPKLAEAVRNYLRESDAAHETALSVGGERYVQNPVQMGARADFGVTVRRSQYRLEVQLLVRSTIPGQPSWINPTPGATITAPNRQYTFTRVNVPEAKGEFKLEGVQRALAVSIARPFEELSTEDRASVVAIGKNLAANEILALLGTAPLDAVAAKGQRDFVALVPDNAAIDAPWLRLQNADLAAVWSTWHNAVASTEDRATRIIKVFPRDPSAARNSRLNRGVVSRFVSDVDRAKRVTLDAPSSFAWALPGGEGEFNWQGRFAHALLGIPTVMRYGDRVALMAFGSLGPSQRNAARNGGYVVPLQNLPVRLRSELTRYLTSENEPFSESVPREMSWNLGETRQSGRTDYGTLALTGRVPDGTLVRIAVYTNSFLTPAQKSGKGSTMMYLDANSLAGYLSRPRGEWDPDFQHVAIANIERVQVEMTVPGAGFSHHSAQVDNVGLETRFYALDELSEPWKSQLAAAIKRQGGG